MDRAAKTAWQREQRRLFKERFGYSTTANYGAGGKRDEVLQRDRFRCVECGMDDAAHKEKWGRPITVDHINKDRSDNRAENLQTLCLKCHGQKDLIPRLRARRIDSTEIKSLRDVGKTYQEIANITGFSIGGVWKALNGERL